MSRVDRSESGRSAPLGGQELHEAEAPPAPEASPPSASPGEPAAPTAADLGLAEARRQDARFAEARARAAIEDRLALNDGGGSPRRRGQPESVEDITRRARAQALEARTIGQEKANDAKYLEYLDFAQDLARRGIDGYRSEGEYLLKPDPLKQRAWETLASRLMDVARQHRNDPEFAKSDPGVIADRILKEDPQVKLAFELVRRSPVPHEYVPLPRQDASLLATAIDALVGFIPVVGDAADGAGALTGRSITGQKLEPHERAVAGVCALIPFLNSAHLRAGLKGADLIADVARQTGRSTDQVEAMFRMVDNLPAGDVQVIRRAADEVLAGGKLSPGLVDDANRVLGKLGGGLEEIAAKGIKRRPNDPFTGEPFKAGTAEHKQQRWIEHQGRNRSEFPEWKSQMDPAWSQAYDRALKNRDAGSAFETGALAKRDLPKNNEVFISPDSRTSFIPDGIRGADGKAVAEVRWGESYNFVEAKNVADLSLGGNLKAQMDYIKEHGGHLDLVIRADTKLSAPLARELANMRRDGLVTIHRE